MVHITNDGQVLQASPWSLSRIFSGIINVVFLFFRTLISPDSSSSESRGSSSQGGSSGWGGSGSGGGPPRPGFPNRRIGRIQHHSNIPIPGGCAGGACGR